MQTSPTSSPAAAPPRWLPAVHVKKPAVLLAVLLTLFATATCIWAMWCYSFDPRLILFCVYLWVFYGTLYVWRCLRRSRYAVLRRGLGYMALGLGVFLSAIFLCSLARVIPLPQTVGVWLFVLLTAYCLYRVIVLHIEEEEEEKRKLEELEGVQVNPAGGFLFEV